MGRLDDIGVVIAGRENIDPCRVQQIDDMGASVDAGHGRRRKGVTCMDNDDIAVSFAFRANSAG